MSLQTVSVCLILGLVVFSEQGTGASLRKQLVGNSQDRPIKNKINGKYNALGCIFEDENYKTIATKEPIWNKKPDGKTLDPTEYNQFKENIRKAFVETVTTSRINDVDPFLWFIEAYKKYPGERLNNSYEDLLRFFNEYNVPYYAVENPVGILIQTFDKMKEGKACTNAEREPYLASANIEPYYLNIADLNKGYPDLKRKQFQDHVAGVIKFHLGTREGYVLLDPGYFRGMITTPFAIVLMQDEKPPHLDIIWGFGMEKMKFTMGDPKDMWVIATDIESTVKHVVYYLGQTFCSFLESTTKGGLLQLDKGMINFDEQGKPDEFLTLSVSQRMDGFALGHYNRDLMISNGIEKIKLFETHRKYTFENIMLKKSSLYKEEIEKSCKLLGMTIETLVGRMQFFYKEFVKDSDLIRNWVQIVSSQQTRTGASLRKQLVGNSQDRPIRNQINGKYNALGCTFEDENYKTIAKKEPIWNKKPDGKTLNPTALNQLKENVREAFVKTVTTSRLNDVDPFVWFIEAYKKYPGERLPNSYQDLLRFFNEYNVPYYADENPVGILINTFDKMEQGKACTEAEKEPYLASAYVVPEYFDTTDLKKGFPELKNKRFQDHVAGVIKFYLGTREGYVLLDPGYFRDIIMSPFAIVLMQDEKPPHQEIIWGFDMENIKFSMGDSKDMWVIATDLKQLTKVKDVVYYLGQTYCSFLESTTKGGLLVPEKGMIKFDEQGAPNEFFTLRVSFLMDSFALGHYNKDQLQKFNGKEMNKLLEVHKYKFKDTVLENSSLNKTSQEEIEKSCKLLGMTTKTLVGRMQFFYEQFVDNPVLIGNWVQIASSQQTTTKTNDNNGSKQGLMTKFTEKFHLKRRQVSYTKDLDTTLRRNGLI